MSENNQINETGNFVNSQGEVVNIVDLLLSKGASGTALYDGQQSVLNNQPARSGKMVASDGSVYNIVDLIMNFAISASDIETTSGETVQEELNNSVKLEVTSGTTQSVGGTLEVQTPDGTNEEAVANVEYVNNIVGNIEDVLETV